MLETSKGTMPVISDKHLNFVPNDYSTIFAPSYLFKRTQFRNSRNNETHQHFKI